MNRSVTEFMDAQRDALKSEASGLTAQLKVSFFLWLRDLAHRHLDGLEKRLILKK